MICTGWIPKAPDLRSIPAACSISWRARSGELQRAHAGQDRSLRAGVSQNRALAAASDDGVQPASQGTRVHRSRLTGDFLTRAENDERWNAANIETPRRRRLVLGVQFGEAQFGFELA